MVNEISKIEPKYVDWAIDNLLNSFSRDSIIEACKRNIRDFPDDAVFFENFIQEMYKFAHHDLLSRYRQLKKEE